MPLLDANGQPISQSGESGTLELAGVPSGSSLFALVWNQAVSALVGWMAGGLVDFSTPPIYVGQSVGGTLFPPNVATYMRFRFLGRTLQVEFGAPDDGVDWFAFGHYDFSDSPLLNAVDNLRDVLELTFRTLDAMYFSGVNVQFMGLATVNPEGDAQMIGDVVKLVVQMTQFGSEPLQISHHFRALTADATFDSLEEDYRTAALIPLSQMMHTTVSITGVKIEDRINAAAPSVQRKTRTYNAAGTYPVPGTVVGGGATGGEPPQLAACLSWETPFAGRSERGRSFVPGMADTASENGLLTDAYKILVRAYADALVNNFGVTLANAPTNPANDWVMVLWREKFSNPAIPSGSQNPAGAVDRTTANPSGYLYLPVTKPPFNPRAGANGIQAAIVRDTVRTQRRRGRGVRIGRRRTVLT